MGCPLITAWTTPRLVFDLGVPGALDNITDVVLTIKQGAVKLDLHANELELDPQGPTISVKLTQEQSGLFDGKRPAEVKANLYYEDGDRLPTDVAQLGVEDNFYEEVMK